MRDGGERGRGRGRRPSRGKVVERSIQGIPQVNSTIIQNPAKQLKVKNRLVFSKRKLISPVPESPGFLTDRSIQLGEQHTNYVEKQDKVDL